MEATGDAAAALADLGRLRGRVRADRQAVTAPLIIFGAIILVHVAYVVATAPAGAGPRHLAVLVFWPIAGAAGLLALWANARRLASREGVGEERPYRTVTLGYVVSLPLLALFFIPAFFLGVWAPLMWPAAIIAAVGIRQQDTTLKRTAEALAAAGIAQGFLTVLPILPEGAQGFAGLAVEGVAALAMIVGALVAARRARTT